MTISLQSSLETCTCWKCGILFAMPAHFQETRREDHKGFFCPNGHESFYLGESDATKYKRLYEREQENARLERAGALHHGRMRVRAENKLKKIRCRVENGVCPHCNRTFKNLQRHMKTKHRRK